MWLEHAEARNLFTNRRFWPHPIQNLEGRQVSDNELPREADVEQVSRRLHQSLKACQVMVANYRVMLSGGANDNEPVGDRGGNSYAAEASAAEEA
jgi:hypothetical protein